MMRHDRCLATILLAGLWLLWSSSVSRAADPLPEMELRDVIHGTIDTGALHELVFFAPKGTSLRPRLRRERGGEDPQVTLSLTGPEGDVLLTDGAPVLLPDTGTYRLKVQAASGWAGRYRLKLRPRLPRRGKWTDSLAEGVEHEVPFGALAGTVLHYRIRGADPSRFTVGGTPSTLTDSSGRIDLDTRGAYTLSARGRGDACRIRLRYRPPHLARRQMYLSAGGFGPRPRIASIDPSVILNDGAYPVIVTGEYFETGATFYLSRGGTDESGRILGATVIAGDDTSVAVLTIDLDSSTPLSPGWWTLSVVNPSGGRASALIHVVGAHGIHLPAGIRPDTEVWHLDFTPDFETDLGLFGLRGENDVVNSLAAGAVKAYVVYLLRTHFLLDGRKGKLSTDSVPVSFAVEAVRPVAGSPGVDYNRLAFGGLPGGASDNSSLAWGYVDVDAGNTHRENVTDGVPTAAMDPSIETTTTDGFRGAFAGLLANPLGSGDLRYFLEGFFPANDAEIDRMKSIVGAVERLGREIAAVAAHHIGRAMGLSNTTSGSSIDLMSTPDKFGVFSETPGLGFLPEDLATLRAQAVAHELPGKWEPLRAGVFPLMPAQHQLLPEATTGIAYTVDLAPVGGRPDRAPGDIRVTLVNGSLPTAFTLAAGGLLGGTAPFDDPAGAYGWYYGAFWFRILVEDVPTGAHYLMWHRLNLLVNLDLVDPTLRSIATTVNETVRSSP